MNISSTSVFSEPLFKFTLTHFRRELPPIHNHRFKPKLFSLLASSNHHSTFCNSSPPHRFQAFATNTDTLESLQSADVLFNQTFPINRIELVSSLSPLPLLLLFFFAFCHQAERYYWKSFNFFSCLYFRNLKGKELSIFNFILILRLALMGFVSELKWNLQLEGKIFVRLDQGKDLKNWELTVGCSLPGKWILHWGVSRLDDAGRYSMLSQVFEFAFFQILWYLMVVLYLIHIIVRSKS